MSDDFLKEEIVRLEATIAEARSNLMRLSVHARGSKEYADVEATIMAEMEEKYKDIPLPKSRGIDHRMLE